jgi:hypothetical protein
MAKVKVYKFKNYDINKDESPVAARMATRKFIQMARGQIIEGTVREIDASLLDGNGQAPIDFQPT